MRINIDMNELEEILNNHFRQKNAIYFLNYQEPRRHWEERVNWEHKKKYDSSNV